MTDASPAPSDDTRPTGPAMLRGLRQLCPSCGQGRLFDGYLKVRPACPVCGEDLTPQRADDGPAYLTILIVGHIMAPLLLFVFTAYRPSPMTVIVLFSTLCVSLSLLLLPRLKGMLIAIQWSRRMHGFGRAEDAAA